MGPNASGSTGSSAPLPLRGFSRLLLLRSLFKIAAASQYKYTMRFTDLRPQLLENAAVNIVLPAFERAARKTTKFIIGGPWQLVFDIIMFTFFPSTRESIERHWREKDWVGLAIDFFTLRGNLVTIASAIIIELVRNTYDELFLEGTPAELGQIPGDDPQVRGHLEQATRTNPAVVGARLQYVGRLVTAEFQRRFKAAQTEFLDHAGQWRGAETGGGAAVGNPYIRSKTQR